MKENSGRQMKSKLLIAVPTFLKERVERISGYSKVYFIQDLGEDELENVLPAIDCMLILHWPSEIDEKRLSIMKNLRMIQTIIGSVDEIPFKHLDERVIVCNNIGAYAVEVAEHAFALLLAAAKGITKCDAAIKSGAWTDNSEIKRGTQAVILKEKKLGILGYGHIGRSVAPLAMAFGMDVCAFARRRAAIKGKWIRPYLGRGGLARILRECDAFILTLPLTKLTRCIIGRDELSLMKKNSILVNVGRAELVDPIALYEHLSMHPTFTYATDVWWYKEGNPIAPTLPFLTLNNFIGTPHISGPTALVRGTMVQQATENLLRYLTGRKLRHVADRSDYA